VPIILADSDRHHPLRSDGSLQDIAPTLLGVLGVREPIEMTGKDLRILPQ
jgi:2,3-bisphosphoglycerate-independent phosphoglycerate mutase